MSQAKTAIILDIRKIKKDDTYPVKLRVTFDRKQRYYPTPFNLSKIQFEKVMYNKRQTDDDKNLKKQILAYENKATDIIGSMKFFSWEKFEKQYYTNRGAKNSINNAFTIYLDKLKEEGRIGTAASYQDARNSLQKFSPDAKFHDITPEFLRKYEKWMLDADKAIATVGIYLRSLRTIINIVISEGQLANEYYPYGKGKYEIPTGRNFKKALTLDKIGLIYNYMPKPGDSAALAKDIWLFLYICNGINIKDLCLLKYNNIKGEFLEFIRAKTVLTKRNVQPIRVPMTDDLKSIIAKHGNPDKNPDNYIFSILQRGITPERERQLIKQFNIVVNDNMNKIAKELNLEINLTTMVARHSFATIMKRGGKGEFVKDALGHASAKTTENYFGSFEDESLIDNAKLLTAFKNSQV